MVICVLGPSRSGKTSLLKRLQDSHFEQLKNFFSLPPTVQTNGTNLLRLIKKSEHRPQEEQEFIVQEIGGNIIELCFDYLPKCHKFVYVVDSSELNQLAFNFKYLMQILTSHSARNKPLLLVLNKADLHCTMQTNEFEEALFLENLKNEFPTNSVSTVRSSCLTGKGLREIYDWITN